MRRDPSVFTLGVGIGEKGGSYKVTEVPAPDYKNNCYDLVLPEGPWIEMELPFILKTGCLPG